jgi:hypothetical protein
MTNDLVLLTNEQRFLEQERDRHIHGGTLRLITCYALRAIAVT